MEYIFSYDKHDPKSRLSNSTDQLKRCGRRRLIEILDILSNIFDMAWTEPLDRHCRIIRIDS